MKESYRESSSSPRQDAGHKRGTGNTRTLWDSLSDKEDIQTLCSPQSSTSKSGLSSLRILILKLAPGQFSNCLALIRNYISRLNKITSRLSRRRRRSITMQFPLANRGMGTYARHSHEETNLNLLEIFELHLRCPAE